MNPDQLQEAYRQLSPDAQAKVRRLLLAHRQATVRTSYLDWCKEILAERELVPAAHHELIIRKVQAVVDGTAPKRRLLIHAPPGSAKSTYTSELLPPYLLNRFPRFNLIGASNTSTLAQDFSTRGQTIVDGHPDLVRYRIKKRAAELWTTTTGGRYRAAGIGETIAGNRADGALIDDPVRSREDADSETMREKAWNWFIADLRTRLKPDAWVIVIMTRWHEDDLGGRLQERQKGLWDVLSIPAEAGLDDPLGRAPGAWLWGDDSYGFGNALQIIKAEYEQAGAMRDWQALFQQEPTAGEGTIFKVAQLGFLDEPPDATPHTVRAWDLAATAQLGTSNPDWTVGVKVMRTKDDRYVVLDVVRFRGAPEEVERRILETAAMDGRRCRIGLPQDPGAAGKSYVQTLGKMLAGYRVEASPETGDKSTRAAPAAAQVNLGNVKLLRGDWNAPFRGELATFPSGMKDDQVDAFSRAFTMVALKRPLVISNETLRELKYGLRRQS